jgi:hypothetical protein
LTNASNKCTITGMGGAATLGELDQLEEELAVLCGQRNALDARLVALTERVLDRGGWEVPGVTSPAHWLVWKAGLSPAHARQVVSLARRRRELAATFAAFGAGELSVDQVTPIVDRAPSYVDAELCEMAKVMTVPQLRRVVRAFDRPATSDGGPRGETLSLPKAAATTHSANASRRSGSPSTHPHPADHDARRARVQVRLVDVSVNPVVRYSRRAAVLPGS